MDVGALAGSKVVPVDAAIAEGAGEFPPWLVVDVPASGDQTLRLCDFASAGATGGVYRSWLAAAKLAPPAPVPWRPRDGERLPKGALGFCWRVPAVEDGERKHTVLGKPAPVFGSILVVLAEDILFDLHHARLAEPGRVCVGRPLAIVMCTLIMVMMAFVGMVVIVMVVIV